jgi:predicted nucleic acid-binding protein
MAEKILPNERLLLDTSFLIALVVSTDNLHARAVALAKDVKAASAQLVTTRAVLLELGNSLARQKHRSAGVALLRRIERDSAVRVEALTEERYAQALALYCSRPDKEWGLVDCLSFSLMRELGISKALTADEHFEQAGFTALLRG